MNSEDRRPLTILIPKPHDNRGYCSTNCLLYRTNCSGPGCMEGLAQHDSYSIKPGFGCPWGVTKPVKIFVGKKKKKRKEKYVYSPEQPDGGFI